MTNLNTLFLVLSIISIVIGSNRETDFWPANTTFDKALFDKTFAFDEDCLSFDTSNITVQPSGERWLLANGNSRMLTFDDVLEAQRTMEVIQFYGMNSQCFVGRPKASLVYWLVQDEESETGMRAPEGMMEQEDCIGFDLSQIEVIQEGDEWLMLDSGKRMKKFPNQDEAEEALAIIQQYGFTQTCYIGRPKASFSYLRK